MERYDIEKQGGHSYGYANAGWKTTQEDEVFIRGTRAEADLMVTALELFVSERRKIQLLGGEVVRVYKTKSQHEPQAASAEKLLDDLRGTHYVDNVTLEIQETLPSAEIEPDPTSP